MTFAPRTTTIRSLRLVKPGPPYWTRPDLGLDANDVKLAKATSGAPRRLSIEVTVHNVGSVASPASSVGLVGAGGKVIAAAAVPAIDAPLDLTPKTATVTIDVPAGTATTGLRVVIDPHNAVREITRKNNVVRM